MCVCNICACACVCLFQCVYVSIYYNIRISVSKSSMYLRTHRCTFVCTYVCMHVKELSRELRVCVYISNLLITLISYCIMYNLYKDVSVCENSRGFLCQSSLASVSNCQTMFKNMMSMPMPLRKKGQQLKLFISQPCLYLQILFFLSDCLRQNMMIGM